MDVSDAPLSRQVGCVLSVLEGILQRSYGPNALLSLITTGTGQLMVTGDSGSVLRSLTLVHPLAAMVTTSALRHVDRGTGDGGKTLVLVLAEFFRLMDHRGYGRIEVVRGLSQLKSELDGLLEPIVARSRRTDVKSFAAVHDDACDLVKTFLSGRFPVNATRCLTDLVVDFVCSGLSEVSDVVNRLRDSIDNYDLLALDAVGFPVTASRILDGFVVQRDFLSLSPTLSKDLHKVRVVLVCCTLTGEDEDKSKAVYAANSTESVQDALLHKARTVSTVTKVLKDKGVQVLISSEKLTNMETTSLQRIGVSVIQMADEAEMVRLAGLLDVQIVHSLTDFMLESSDYVSETGGCGTVIVSGQRFVHFKINEHLNKQFLFAGHSKGACCQVRTAVGNCLRYLHHWLTTPVGKDTLYKGLSIHAGGTFELLLHKELLRRASIPNTSEILRTTCRLLAESVLVVPRTLLENSFSGHTPGKIRGLLKQDIILGLDGRSGDVLSMDSGPRDSLPAKVDLIYNLIDSTNQILKIDKLLPIRS